MDERVALVLQALQWVLDILEKENYDGKKVYKRVKWMREEILERGVEDFEYRFLSQI